MHPIFSETHRQTLLKLYPEYDIVQGPYKRPDLRYHLILKNSVTGKCTTISYPKAFMEASLDERLSPELTVDHVDEDKTNNDPSNFQIMPRAENAKKSGYVSGIQNLTKAHEYNRTSEGRKLLSMRSSGENNPNAHFKSDEVPDLRLLYTDGTITISEICEKYKVSRRTATNMLNGTTYSSCPGPLRNIRVRGSDK